MNGLNTLKNNNFELFYIYFESKSKLPILMEKCWKVVLFLIYQNMYFDRLKNVCSYENTIKKNLNLNKFKNRMIFF